MSSDDVKSFTQARFGQFAQNYVNSPVHAAGADLDYLLEVASPQATWTMLDVATGGGHTALKFAPHVARVVASDIGPTMLNAAREFIGATTVGNIAFVGGDAENLPFPDGAFD